MTTAGTLHFEHHLVICGWKQDIHLILKEILLSHPTWAEGGIVVVAEVTDAEIEALRSFPELASVVVIQEDYFGEAALLKANVQKANRAVVLANWTDLTETATETDAKTVMAAMAIEKLAPQVYVVAELLDLDFLQYLKMARVDEIVYSREYTRILLANAATNAGIAHVVHDLFDSESICELTSVGIPAEFVGKTFAELCEWFESVTPPAACVGILENTDNLQELKRRALSVAQKNPDTRTVLKNLSKVKEIETNRALLNPGWEYVVPENSMAVIIQNRQEPRGG